MLANRNGSTGQTPGLVGHYFLFGPDPHLQTHALRGRIVSVEATGVYLVEVRSWLGDEPLERRLVRLDEMEGWTFFDSAESWCDRGDEIRGLTWQNAGENDRPF